MVSGKPELFEFLLARQNRFNFSLQGRAVLIAHCKPEQFPQMRGEVFQGLAGYLLSLSAGGAFGP